MIVVNPFSGAVTDDLISQTLAPGLFFTTLSPDPSSTEEGGLSSSESSHPSPAGGGTEGEGREQHHVTNQKATEGEGLDRHRTLNPWRRKLGVEATIRKFRIVQLDGSNRGIKP